MLQDFPLREASQESSSAASSPVDAPQSWRAWVGQKIKVSQKGMYGMGSVNTELVNVFPGWAVRRYPTAAATTAATISPEEPKPFELEVFVSGYVNSCRPPESASRSQRAFMRLARGYAYLPKLVDDTGNVVPHTSSTPSTEEILRSDRLPPRPTEKGDDYDMEALERQLLRAKKVVDNDGSSASSSPSSSTDDLPTFLTSGQTTVPPLYFPSTAASTANDARLHANLEKRLQPFWSSALPKRTVRLHLFTPPYQGQKGSTTPRKKIAEDDDDELLMDSEGVPLASQDVVTAADGSFQVKFNVNWEQLCHHPTALQIAFGRETTEHDLLVVAQLLPANDPSGCSAYVRPPIPPSVPLTSLRTRIPITHSLIRVISDVDDTIKLSGILLGARTLFHNVFVKDLTENVIPGMGEWYANMWKNGVRFHYVSNGPFEYLPILTEFFEISKLPPGSVKLRSYTGRSLFSGLLSTPAARKRGGVVHVLDSFPDSRFFLIGDSGEQDLELYAELARERPDRILAVFVRDADSSTDPLEDPTGCNLDAIAIGAAGTRTNSRPLFSRSKTTHSTSSLSTDLLSRNNYSAPGSPLNSVNTDAHQTPCPNASNSEERGKNPTTIYFGNNVLMSEPDAMDEGPDPAVMSFSRTKTSGKVQLGGRSSSIISRLSAKFTSQSLKPTDSPSIHNGAHARSSVSSSRSQQRTPSTFSTKLSGIQPLTEAEKRRRSLQMRVYRARTQIPQHVPMRVFRDPKECVEAQEILARESATGSN